MKFALALLLGVISSTTLLAAQPARPNILYFYVDDMGGGSIGQTANPPIGNSGGANGPVRRIESAIAMHCECVANGVMHQQKPSPGMPCCDLGNQRTGTSAALKRI